MTMTRSSWDRRGLVGDGKPVLSVPVLGIQCLDDLDRSHLSASAAESRTGRAGKNT